MLPGVEKRSVSTADWFKRILPMSLFFACGLVLSNMAYKYISLSYIQMVKAFTPVPLLLLSFAFGREKPSLMQLGIVCIVSTGVTLSSVGELQFSLLGFAIQVSAVMVDCFRMLIMDVMLKDLNLDSLSLLYYTAPPLAAMIFVGFVIFEQWCIFLVVCNGSKSTYYFAYFLTRSCHEIFSEGSGRNGF